MRAFQDLYDYVAAVRRASTVDINSIVNTTLIANPYITKFPRDFLLNRKPDADIRSSLVWSITCYYSRNAMRVFKYLALKILYQIYFKKKPAVISEDCFLIDLYVDVPRVVSEKAFRDRYFGGLYRVLNDTGKTVVFLPRLVGISNNPIVAYRQSSDFFKIISSDSQSYLFEFESFSASDFLQLLKLYILYPFRILRMLANDFDLSDQIFNFYLKSDISTQSIVPFTRYIFGKNLGNVSCIKDVISWSEFQVTERALNYGLRESGNAKITACQFLVTYPNHFNMHVQDIDEEQGCAPHLVLANGPEYVLPRKKVNYQAGVSLRYEQVFTFQPRYDGSRVLVLGSYSLSETMNILDMISGLRGALFKSHPALESHFSSRYLGADVKTVTGNIYDFFPQTAVVIGAASGSLLEAIACGVSVLLVAKKNELITNPMNEVGRGQIWDIAYSPAEVVAKNAELIAYRATNKPEIVKLAKWYRDNCFVEPTTEKILETFNLVKNT